MKTSIILSILKDLGIYDRARERFQSDKDLARMFTENFDELCEMFTVEPCLNF